MELFILDRDITVHCCRASSFPDGIQAAHEALHTFFLKHPPANYVGISYMDASKQIIYLAGIEEANPGELAEYNLESFTIKKGKYISEILPGFMEKLEEIKNVIGRLIQHPEVDPQGYAVEWFMNDNECRCMAKLRD